MAPAVTGWPRRRSWPAACRIARWMNAVVLLSEHSQPRIVPAYASITNAAYANPPPARGT